MTSQEGPDADGDYRGEHLRMVTIGTAAFAPARCHGQNANSLSAVRSELEVLHAQVSAVRVTLEALSAPSGANQSLVQTAVEDVLPPLEPPLAGAESGT